MGHKISFTKAQVWLRRSQNWGGGSGWPVCLSPGSRACSSLILFPITRPQYKASWTWHERHTNADSYRGISFCPSLPTQQSKTKTPSYGWAQGGHFDDNCCLCVWAILPGREKHRALPALRFQTASESSFFLGLRASWGWTVKSASLFRAKSVLDVRGWGLLTPDNQLASGPSAPYP